MSFRAIFGKDGQAREFEVVMGLGDWKYGFETNAIEAVKQWQFEPGIVDGASADVQVVLKMDYILHNYN